MKKDNSEIYGHVQREALINDLTAWAMRSVRYSATSFAWSCPVDEDDEDGIREVLSAMSISSLMHPLAVKFTLAKNQYEILEGNGSPSQVIAAHKRIVTHHDDMFSN